MSTFDLVLRVNQKFTWSGGIEIQQDLSEPQNQTHSAGMWNLLFMEPFVLGEAIGEATDESFDPLGLQRI